MSKERDRADRARLAIIKKARRFKSMMLVDIFEKNYSGAARKDAIVHGLLVAAEIIQETK